MTEDVADTQDETRKSSKLPLVLGLIAALLGGGGGFYATYSGLILGGKPELDAASASGHTPSEMPDVSYVPMDALTISLGPRGGNRILRFRANLEVGSQHAAEVELVLPRVIDVLNDFLRAVEPSDIENPSSLMRLRAQMLRRVNLVVGDGRVRDLLIMEFVLT